MSLHPLNIIIADDEAPARNRIRELLREIDHANLVAEAKNGLEVLSLVEELRANIVLLDIRMPQMDGIEAAAHLQKMQAPPAIIFTTAFDAYALKAFEMSAIDYLLKPIRLERLQSALNKARALLPAQLAAIKPLQSRRTHFSVYERGRVMLIALAEVIYLKAELKYTTLRTKNREFIIEDSLTSVEEEFSEYFLRLHRNCLVAQHAILGYEKVNSDDKEQQWVAILKDIPETINVSRRQLQALKNFRQQSPDC